MARPLRGLTNVASRVATFHGWSATPTVCPRIEAGRLVLHTHGDGPMAVPCGRGLRDEGYLFTVRLPSNEPEPVDVLLATSIAMVIR